MIRFALLHGAWHDASCWLPLVGELAGRGHEAVAVDLPSDRPGLGAGAYADAALAAVGPVEPPDRVVVVGHSLGGLTAPVVADRLGQDRVAALVLIGALVPRPGSSFDDQVRADPAVLVPGSGRGQRRHEDGTTWWPPEAAATALYRGVAAEASEQLVVDAVARLRPQAWTISHEVTPLVRWPAVPTVVVVCADDQMVDPGWLRANAREVPGADVVELAGGHFPMLTRPAELAAILERAAERG